MKIPSNNIWTQLNNGDLLGVLAETENITLDSHGKIQLSKKVFNRLNSDDYSNLNNILSIVYYNNQYLALTTSNAFLYDFGSSTTTEIALTSDVNNYSDMIVCYGVAYISTDDNLDFYDGSLNASNYALTSGKPHPMTVFDSLSTYKLCVGNGNTVIPLSSSHTANTILTLPSQYEVTTLAYKNGYLYVGTKHLNGGEAKIFVWDGNTANANFEISTGASQIYSIKPYRETLAFVTNTGRIAQISGTGAITLAAFPVYYQPNSIWDNTDYSSAPPKILNRGVVAVNDQIYFNIDGTVDSGNLTTMKHGLWVYDHNFGLYHRAYHSQDRSVVETPSALSDDTLTISTHNLKTGDLVIIRTVGSLTGVDTNVKYYAKVESPTTIKLAKSKKALQNGNYVSIGGTVTGSNISYTPNLDYTNWQNVFAGAITAINPEEPFFLGWESPVLWGSRIQDLDGNELHCLMSFTENWNIGRLTTQRIYAEHLTQSWTKINGFFDGLNLDNEKIIIKYKTEDSFGYPSQVFQGVWLDENKINSVSTLDEDEWNDIEEGDEVNIIDGYGRGYTAHVTSKTTNTTFTIELDESIGTANKTVYFYIDKFKKLATITNENRNKGYFSESLSNVNSSWIQFKFELRGYQISISSLDLINSVHSKS